MCPPLSLQLDPLPIGFLTPPPLSLLLRRRPLLINSRGTPRSRVNIMHRALATVGSDDA